MDSNNRSSALPPGPFHADGCFIKNDRGETVAETDTPELAIFFAASTDMAEALDTAAITLEYIEQRIECMAPDSPALQKIKAAILKAGG